MFDASFQQAIKATPTDRNLQLVYADFVDERGDPDFAAALRAKDFSVLAGIAAQHDLPLRAVWQMERTKGRLLNACLLFALKVSNLLTVATLGSGGRPNPRRMGVLGDQDGRFSASAVDRPAPPEATSLEAHD